MIVLPLPLDGEIQQGARLGDLLLDAAAKANLGLRDGDVLVVTQKVVSKAEGRIARIDPDDPARRKELIEAESSRVLRRRGNLLITQTKQGFVCANAGIDSSNVEPGFVSLLPADPDASARRIRSRIRAAAGLDLAVIVSDTFGRAWRTGQTNVAIGVAGFRPLRSYYGTQDQFGATLHATNIAQADELAGAAELVMGKAEGVPAALIRDAPITRGRGSAQDLIRPANDDLFR